MTKDERAELERMAKGRSLSAVVRARLFGDKAAKRSRPSTSPIADHRALAKVLSLLGRSGLAGELAMLKWADETAALLMDPETAGAVRRACDDIAEMRADLVRALGLRGE
ncbi:MAG: hypothetical protein AAF968_09940 [Pseudomonadota bacterium]